MDNLISSPQADTVAVPRVWLQGLLRFNKVVEDYIEKNQNDFPYDVKILNEAEVPYLIGFVATARNFLEQDQ